MKFAAILGFMAAQSSATTTLSVSVDEQEAMRVAGAVTGRVQQWVGTNQDDLMTAAQSVQTIVQDFVKTDLASAGNRSQSMLGVLNGTRQLVFADPDACDENAFAQCLVSPDGPSLSFGRNSPFHEVFTSDCAVTNGCTALCFNPTFSYEVYTDWESWSAAKNESGCTEVER